MAYQAIEKVGPKPAFNEQYTPWRRSVWQQRGSKHFSTNLELQQKLLKTAGELIIKFPKFADQVINDLRECPVSGDFDAFLKNKELRERLPENIRMPLWNAMDRVAARKYALETQANSGDQKAQQMLQSMERNWELLGYCKNPNSTLLNKGIRALYDQVKQAIKSKGKAGKTDPDKAVLDLIEYLIDQSAEHFKEDGGTLSDDHQDLKRQTLALTTVLVIPEKHGS